MEFSEALRRMRDITGIAFSSASRKLGKSAQYLSVMISNDSSPRLDTCAAVANIFGFKLIVRIDNLHLSIRKSRDLATDKNEMSAEDALRTVVDACPISKYEISKKMGKSAAYISSLLDRERIPTLATFVTVSEACNDEVFLQGHGKQIYLSDKAAIPASEHIQKSELDSYEDYYSALIESNNNARGTTDRPQKLSSSKHEGLAAPSVAISTTKPAPVSQSSSSSPILQPRESANPIQTAPSEEIVQSIDQTTITRPSKPREQPMTKEQQKLSAYKDRLLDLSMRNNMLSYKDRKTGTLRIIEPGLEQFYQLLVLNEKPMTFRDSSPDEDDGSARMRSTGSSFIVTEKTKGDLTRSLRRLDSVARASIDEQGINILYLAFGMLRWIDDAQKEHYAPLVMVPVRLSRVSARSSCVLQANDDDPIANPTLGYFLGENYGLSLPLFEKEDRLLEYLSSVASVIQSKQGWAVTDDVVLSTFQFQKLSMYHDLETRSTEILTHPVVKAIMGNGAALKQAATIMNPDAYSPYDTFQVVDADASQQQAILAAHNGESFVLQGPPGTGKSQTITNIIADCLGSGKSVLFVSEKKAALDVVYRRLSQVNLQDFCLVLHSNKAGKKEVLAQLDSTLKLHGRSSRVGAVATTRLNTMVQLRNALNSYSEEIYKPLPMIDRSPYEVIGIISSFTQDAVPYISCKIQDIGNVGQTKLAEMSDAVRAYGVALEGLGCAPEDNPWNRVGISKLEYGESEEVIRAATIVAQAAHRLGNLYAREVQELGVIVDPTFNSISASVDLLDDLAKAPRIPKHFTKKGPKSSRRILSSWTELDNKVSESCEKLYQSLKNLAQVDPDLNLHAEHSRLGDCMYVQELARSLSKRLSEISCYAAWQHTPSGEVDQAIATLDSRIREYAEFRDAILFDYHPEILDIDFLAMESRFKTDYKSLFKRLGGQHRSDINLLTSLRKTAAAVDDEAAVQVLANLHLLSNMERSIDETAEENERVLGSCYRGIKTDFSLIAAKRSVYSQAQVVQWQLEEHLKQLERFREYNKQLSALLGNAYSLDSPSWVSKAEEAISTLESLSESYGIKYRGVKIGSALETLDKPAASKTAAELATLIRTCLDSTKEAMEELDSRNEAVDLQRTDLSKLAEDLDRAIPSGPQALEKSATFIKAHNNCVILGLKDYLDVLSKDSRALNPDFIDQYDEILQHTFYRLWLGTVALKKCKALSSFNAKEHNRRVERFDDLDSEQLGIDQARVLQKLFPRIPSINDTRARGKDELSILVRELGKKTRLRPIRKLFADIPHAILKLKPCLMMSPLSVSTYLESATFQFDTVIFDEASQVRTEDALGVISRGKQVIIAGDSKQLPPTNFFKSTIEDDEEEYSDEYYDEQAGSYDSVLDEAALLNPIWLKWHYRSRDESLIAFSNNRIYDGELFTFPSSKMTGKDTGVEFVYVSNGIYEGSRKGNKIEAARVVDLVFQHFATYGTNRSLGVIALGENQSRIIESELLRRRIDNPASEQYFDTAIDEPFFVKNLENVQGDERDTIILCVGFAKGPNGKLSHNFGPINGEGGERRLNVAVTRARKNLKLVSSIDPSEINTEHVTNIGPKMLKDYLAYAKMGSSGSSDSSYREYGYFTEDLFLKVIHTDLENAGFTVDENVGRSGCKIDLGVRHPEHPDCYCIGIVCDGDSYHAATTARDRDRLRSEVLEGMGWTLYHVWAGEWIKDQEAQREALLEAVRKAVESFIPPVEEADEPTGTSEPTVEPSHEIPRDTSAIISELDDEDEEEENEEATPSVMPLRTMRDADGKHLYGFQSYANYEAPDRDLVSDVGVLKQLIYAQAPFSMDYFIERYRDLLYPPRTPITYALKQSGKSYLQTKLKNLVQIRIEHGVSYIFRRDQHTILPRVAGPRSIDDISTSELRAGVVAVMRGFDGNLDRLELINETAAAFEFKLLESKIRERIGEAIDDLQQSRELRYENGHYVLVKKGFSNE